MRKLITLLVLLCSINIGAQKVFVHPGLSHTRADIDRMKSMIAAKQEPFYSAYLNFASAATSSYNYSIQNVKPTQSRPDKMDALLANDGHAAHNIALMWWLTGDDRYANKAVEILNNFNGIVNVSSCGTGPLNSSKVYLLIEAAELMRDYSGWAKADQEAFKAMLVYPGYSTKKDMFKLYANNNDDLNGITWYWNVYNFDCGRHGNQETLAMRMMLDLGVYRDNDTIYNRAKNYYLGLAHPTGDLPYVSGPPAGMSSKATTNCDYFNYYATSKRTFGSTADYGYNGQLSNYVWNNGQVQESSRDQGHSGGGLSSLANIAEVAWNQGDDLYSTDGNRLLLGFEWYSRYNLSYIEPFGDQPTAWEPAGYTGIAANATFDNGLFIQQFDRSKQWFSKKPNPYNESSWDGSSISRGTAFTPSHATWTETYMHYAVRMGLDSTQTDHSDMADNPSMHWLTRAYTESSSKGLEDNGWTTDWVGWGDLTKYRTKWMAGDPCRFNSDGSYTLGIHSTSETIRAVDYDFFNNSMSGQNHTYYDTTTGNSGNTLRNDGVDIIKDDTDYVVTDVQPGEWMNYTISVNTTGNYTIRMNYKTGSSTNMAAAIDGSGYNEGTLPATDNSYGDAPLTRLTLKAGAHVIRLKATGTSATDIRIKSIEVVRDSTYSFLPEEWTTSNATSNATFETTDKSITVTAKNLTVGAHATWSINDAPYYISTDKTNFVVKGNNIRSEKISLNLIDSIKPDNIYHTSSLIAPDNDSVYVWNLADDTNSGIKSLLNKVSGHYPLSQLSLYANNAKSELTFTISDIGFYTDDEVSKMGVPASINTIYGKSNDDNNDKIYTIDGKQVNGSYLNKGIYIKKNKKQLYY